MGLKEELTKLLDKASREAAIVESVEIEQEAKTIEESLFVKTRQLLDKVKLYQALTTFQTDFFEQERIVTELLLDKDLTYAEYEELVTLQEDIRKKILAENRFPGCHSEHLPDQVRAILFDSYSKEHAELIQQQQELSQALEEKQRRHKELVFEIAKEKHLLGRLRSLEYRVFCQTTDGLTVEDMQRLSAKGIVLR